MPLPSRAVGTVPVVRLLALPLVAIAAKLEPLVLVQVMAPVLASVQSPDSATPVATF